MNLNRVALTELLPGVREGLHSAILTTFSFDFYFFEMVLLRRLRSIGVRNVVVLADAAMLHEATRFSSGFGSPRTKTYSLVPVDCGGAFHPKMVCLFGEKSGWLAVGSGNLTESGYGKNDEVWGAFYFSKNHVEHENLFAGAWDFIRFLDNGHLKGFPKKQVADAAQFAPWLADLPPFDAGKWSETSDHCRIKWIRAGGEKSVWAQLLQNLPTGEINQVTVVSPFFDTKGTLLEKLSGEFPGAEFRVVVEPDWVQLPLRLDDKVQKRLQFFGWKKITDVPEQAGNRWLHAKIFVFETKTQGSFCFFGSSNATEAGFGNSSSNLETNLLLHSQTSDFLKILGLKIEPSNSNELSVLAAASRSENGLHTHSNRANETFIPAAELDERQLCLFFTKPLNRPAMLVLFDAEGLELQSTESVFDQSGIAYFKYTGKTSPFSCQIFDAETRSPLSNRQVVAHLADLRKTNPDPARAKLEAILDRMRDGENSAITDILSLIDLETPEPQLQIREQGLKIGQEQAVFESTENSGTDVELSEEAFTRIPEERVYRSHFLYFDPARDLSDFLLQIGLNQIATLHETDGEEDEELLDAETGERKDGASIAASKKTKPETTDKEAEAVKVFLGRFRKVLASATSNYLTLLKKNEPPIPLTFRDLSHFLIALRLMVRYGNRKPTDAQKAFPVFPFRHGTAQIWNPKKMDSVQVACYEIIGKMLLLFNSGIRLPQTVQEKTRLEALKEAIFYDTVFLISSALSEKKEDADYLPLFYFNLLLHYQALLPIDSAALKIQMETRGKFGSGISPEVLKQAETDFQRFSAFFQTRIANKDLKNRHRIPIENNHFLLLEKQFGVCLATDKNIARRFHPGGICDKETEYFLTG